MARQLFGTDGIRGVAGEYPLDPVTVFAFGRALGRWAVATAQTQGAANALVLIGMDTRESGPWLAETAAAGMAREGAQPRLAGVITTPGVAYLTRTLDFVAGLMISASHNPYQDNGLKVFGHSGFKLPDEVEHGLEEAIFALREETVSVESLALTPDENLDNQYLDYLASACGSPLEGLRLVIDAANGAAWRLAPALFRRLGAKVVDTGCAPNGRNINLDCGALHTGALRAAVPHYLAHAGCAFDGDADRCMMVSNSGRLIDGDQILWIAAQRLAGQGRKPASMVATVMSNLGLERALASLGIGLIRTSVGDKYVLEEMVRSDLPVGGEQSGHVIFRDSATTGDGLLTALRVLEAMRSAGATLDELTREFVSYPQRLINVRFREKRPLEDLPEVQAAIAATQRAFGDAGRVLVRFSGTEPLARVMVEGPDMDQVSRHARRIAGAIASALA